MDNCPFDTNFGQENNDNDTQGDICDTDDDNDSIPDDADPDDDNDGIPDTFELNNGLNPLNAADANEDADGDGFTNLREFRAGTDPQDQTSKPVSMPWLPLADTKRRGNCSTTCSTDETP